MSKLDRETKVAAEAASQAGIFEGLEEAMEAFVETKTESRAPGKPTQTMWSELPALDHLASLILEVDSHAAGQNESDEMKIRNHNRKLLAAQLGCTPEDLQGIVDSYGEQWQQYVLEARVRLGASSTHMRDSTWDRLEAATLKKLTILVENPVARLTVAELLAVARTANMANRGDRSIKGPGQGVGGGPQPSGIQIGQAVFMGGDPTNGVLPAGNLGTINLNLSQRVLKQLNTPKQIEGESVRVLDRMEMMGIKDIQKIGEGLDKESKDDSK